jgi:hypothetical protein
MRCPRFALLALLAALLPSLLSGCSSADPPPGPAQPEAPAPETASGTWTLERFTGDFVTTQPANPQGAVEQNDFGMPEGVAQAWLNVTIDGLLPGEVSLHFRPPGCAGGGCTIDVTTTGGEAAALVEGPAAGTWSFVLFAADGAQAGSYTLDVAMLRP